MYSYFADGAATQEARTWLDEQLVQVSYPYGEGPIAQAQQDALLAAQGIGGTE